MGLPSPEGTAQICNRCAHLIRGLKIDTARRDDDDRRRLDEEDKAVRKRLRQQVDMAMTASRGTRSDSNVAGSSSASGGGITSAQITAPRPSISSSHQISESDVTLKENGTHGRYTSVSTTVSRSSTGKEACPRAGGKPTKDKYKSYEDVLSKREGSQRRAQKDRVAEDKTRKEAPEEAQKKLVAQKEAAKKEAAKKEAAKKGTAKKDAMRSHQEAQAKIPKEQARQDHETKGKGHPSEDSKERVAEAERKKKPTVANPAKPVKSSLRVPTGKGDAVRTAGIALPIRRKTTPPNRR